MKTPTKILRSIVALSSCLAVTSALGQITYTWTNQNPAQSFVGDLGLATNYSPNAVPSSQTGPDPNGVFGDIIEFSGATTGNLMLTSNTGQTGASGNPVGLRFHLTSAQTGSVTIYAPFGLGTASGGTRLQGAQTEPGSGGLILGDNVQNTNILDFVSGGVNGQIQGFTNNSSVPCVINPAVRFRMGGAGGHTHVFEGPGDWIINNHLRSANSSSMVIQKGGSGTMTWTGTNVGARAQNWFDPIGSPLRITGGTLILKTSDLLTADAGGPNIVHNGTLLKYDVQPNPPLVTDPATIPANISGTGAFEMHAGVLTLSGASTFSGPINLTGGELIAGSVEAVGTSGPLGQGGTISFNGGTLGWNLANAFDYSSRFDTSANQTYNLDTGGSSPTFATGLSSSGGSLNKLGGGTLTLAGPSTYTGPTTVAAGGGLIFQGTKSGNANITVADTATLGVFENGSQITPNTLTLGTSTGATLEFNNVINHTTAPLAPNNLVSAGTVTININSGKFILIGEPFALLRWTNGPAPATTLGFLAGAGGHLSTNGNEIDVIIDNPPYIWTGALSTTWDTSTVDWVRNALPATWINGNFALFDDSSTVTNVTMSGIITPTNVTIASSEPYAITNSPGNVIGGGGGLTKSGSGSLVLPGGANTYTGVTTIGGGILDINILANGGLASDIGAASSAAGNIVFNGGTLQYTGPGLSIDRLFTLGPGGGTIDNESGGQLVFNNTGSLGMSGNGPRTLTLTGPGFGDTLACNLTNHPAGTSLIKNGTGVWFLTGTNTFAGGTTLLQGGLQIGTGGASGAIGNGTISTVTGTTIDFNRTGSLLVPGSINGGASVTLDGSGTVILANNNGYTGGTTINAGTLQLGNGGGTGALVGNGAIINNSLLVFNTAGAFAYQGTGIISGNGNVIFQGGGLIKAIGANSYTGWTRIDASTTFFCREGQDGALATSAITNNGTLRMVDQNNPGFSYSGLITGSGRVQVGANNFNTGLMTLLGTNSYTGGTFIGDNTLVLGDGFTPQSGTIAGNVAFVNNFTTSDDNVRTLVFNRPVNDNFVFGGNITTNFTSAQNNQGIVQINGGATATLSGNNTYAGGTVVANGAIVVGNGGSSGSLGWGPVALNSGAPLIINRSGVMAQQMGNVSGLADVIVQGGGTLTFAGVNNTYSGATTVSNGTLIVNGTNVTSSTHVYVGGLGGKGEFTSAITMEPGTTLLPGASSTSIGTFTADSDLLLGGNLTIKVIRTASPANDFVSVGGVLSNSAPGTLLVKNLTSAPLQVGDRFVLFNKPVLNGAVITVAGARATWINNIATDGSITVGTVLGPPTLNFANTGSSLQFSWSDPLNSFRLQAQTNGLNRGISTNWADYPGGGSSPVIVPLVKTNATVFFRLFVIP